MESSPNPKSLSSQPFEIVAKSGKCFFVHSDILAAHSSTPRRTAISVSTEATGRKIDLSAWDDDTVERFVHFLYYKDYKLPTLEAEGAENDEVGGRDGANTPDTVQSLEDREGARGENVLLAHAKLYVLAKHQDIEKLRMMALERLEMALEEISWTLAESTSSVTANVVELLGYVYSHTDRLTDLEEPIQDLVSTFAAENFGNLNMIDRSDMKTLLADGDELVVGLVGRLVNRINEVTWELNRVQGDAAETHTELRSLEQGLESSEAHAAELREKVQRLEIEKAGAVREANKMKKCAASMKGLLGAERATKARPWWRGYLAPELTHPTFLFTTAVSSVVIIAIMISLIFQQFPQQKLENVGERPFEGICQYYEAHSWAGSNLVTVDGKPLKEACGGYTSDPWAQKSSNSGETKKAIFKYIEENLWMRGDLCSVGRKRLEQYCNVAHHVGWPHNGKPETSDPEKGDPEKGDPESREPESRESESRESESRWLDSRRHDSRHDGRRPDGRRPDSRKESRKRRFMRRVKGLALKVVR